MTQRIFSNEQKARLTQVINEGCQTMHEIDSLNEGLSDLVKAVAEEMEIKAATLKKAIKIAHKASLTKTNQDHEELVQILETVGKTL
jgi:transposase-like protein